jgi:acyl-CoA thioester hydrolase
MTATTHHAGVSITVDVPVRLDEIDYLGIVHGSNYLKYMEHARVKLLEQQRVDLLAWVKKGVRAVVVNDTVNYRQPAVYGDVLAVTCIVEELGESATKLRYSMTEQRTGRGILQATTTIVCIGPDDRPIPIPAEVRAALSRPV